MEEQLIKKIGFLIKLREPSIAKKDLNFLEDRINFALNYED